MHLLELNTNTRWRYVFLALKEDRLSKSVVGHGKKQKQKTTHACGVVRSFYENKTNVTKPGKDLSFKTRLLSETILLHHGVGFLLSDCNCHLNC